MRLQALQKERADFGMDAPITDAMLWGVCSVPGCGTPARGRICLRCAEEMDALNLARAKRWAQERRRENESLMPLGVRLRRLWDRWGWMLELVFVACVWGYLVGMYGVAWLDWMRQ